MYICIPASEDVGDDNEFVPGNIDLLCPIYVG